MSIDPKGTGVHHLSLILKGASPGTEIEVGIELLIDLELRPDADPRKGINHNIGGTRVSARMVREKEVVMMRVNGGCPLVATITLRSALQAPIIKNLMMTRAEILLNLGLALGFRTSLN